MNAMLQTSQRPIPADAIPTSEVEGELNRLANTCDILSKTATHLIERLSPVVRCTGAGQSGSATPPSPPRAVLSPVADRIDNLRARIESVTNDLSASIDALAI